MTEPEETRTFVLKTKDLRRCSSEQLCCSWLKTWTTEVVKIHNPSPSQTAIIIHPKCYFRTEILTSSSSCLTDGAGRGGSWWIEPSEYSQPEGNSPARWPATATVTLQQHFPAFLERGCKQDFKRAEIEMSPATGEWAAWRGVRTKQPGFNAQHLRTGQTPN